MSVTKLPAPVVLLKKGSSSVRVNESWGVWLGPASRVKLVVKGTIYLLDCQQHGETIDAFVSIVYVHCEVCN